MYECMGGDVTFSFPLFSSVLFAQCCFFVFPSKPRDTVLLREGRDSCIVGVSVAWAWCHLWGRSCMSWLDAQPVIVLPISLYLIVSLSPYVILLCINLLSFQGLLQKI